MCLFSDLSLLQANVVLDLFFDGGPIMYPMVIAVVLGVAVTLERFLWWTGFQLRRRPRECRACLDRLERSQLGEAEAIAAGSNDPVLRVLHQGLIHRQGNLEAAVQAAATEQLRPAARGTAILDTLITMGPLLGLLGTVTGIMASFVSMGGAELAIDKVTGGIGEALIATAFGLGIALLALIPYNCGNVRINRLQSDIELAVNRLEIALGRGRELTVQQKGNAA